MSSSVAGTLDSESCVATGHSVSAHDSRRSPRSAIGYLYTAFASECPVRCMAVIPHIPTLGLAVMIFYDYALCLEHEIDLFWRAKFVWPTWIFLANRYVLLLYGIGCVLQVPLWTTPMVSSLNPLISLLRIDLFSPQGHVSLTGIGGRHTDTMLTGAKRLSSYSTSRTCSFLQSQLVCSDALVHAL